MINRKDFVKTAHIFDNPTERMEISLINFKIFIYFGESCNDSKLKLQRGLPRLVYRSENRYILVPSWSIKLTSIINKQRQMERYISPYADNELLNRSLYSLKKSLRKYIALLWHEYRWSVIGLYSMPPILRDWLSFRYSINKLNSRNANDYINQNQEQEVVEFNTHFSAKSV